MRQGTLFFPRCELRLSIEKHAPPIRAETSPAMHQFYHQALRIIERMTMQHWFFVLIGVVLVGLFCMRGFGSRTHY